MTTALALPMPAANPSIHASYAAVSTIDWEKGVALLSAAVNADTFAAGESVMATNVERYWQQFLHSMPSEVERPTRYLEAFGFGFSPADAKEIAPLVLAGTKTATGALLWASLADGKPVPTVGDFSIVTLGGDDPVCIIETTDIRTIPFDEVPADYAWQYGEWERSLEGWRARYWSYIERECKRLGREPSARAPLLMERFCAVYTAPLE